MIHICFVILFRQIWSYGHSCFISCWITQTTLMLFFLFLLCETLTPPHVLWEFSPQKLENVVQIYIYLSVTWTYLSLLFIGCHHKGFPNFTHSCREWGSVSSSAFVLLLPPGSHPAAGGPRLADSVALGDKLDTDAGVRRHFGHCSGDKSVIFSWCNCCNEPHEIVWSMQILKYLFPLISRHRLDGYNTTLVTCLYSKSPAGITFCTSLSSAI